MKYIVLAAGSGVGSITAINNLPKCLIKINGKTVIQNVEEVCFENNITDINIVGGFEILKIMQEYPEHKYFYNEKWEKTNSLYSLHKVINIVNDDIIVSYSDVIHDADTISNLIQHAENINIIYDSLWRNRYENRDIDNIEKVFNSNMDLVGEFAGLCFIPKKSLPDIRVKTSELLHKNLKFSILDLIAEMLKSNDILLTDVKGNWAELDSIQDVNHFKFGTKAETLESLRNRLVLSSVLEQYTFSVSDYIKDKNNVFLSIQSKLKSKLLVVRSSALDEDTHDTSNAGNYKSVLKVLKDDISALEKSIEMVVDSYNKGGRSQNNNHQVLVQPYLEKVTMSGVVLTKNLQTSSPYYTVNYDVSSNTESVTSGGKGDLITFICYRNSTENIDDPYLKILIKAVKEVEDVTSFDALDIEFAFVNETLYILQVRPIAANKKTVKVADVDIDSEINDLKKYLDFSPPTSLLLGNKYAYGVMPDWNAAEIIGINPKPLSFDLYRYIITDNVWSKSRAQLGYRDVGGSAGLISFARKPYVDIKMSFNTFTPVELNNEIAEKLIDYSICKLEKYPELHDKVEFNIMITSFDLDFEVKQKELLEAGFTNDEINQITISYKKLTQRIINEEITSIDKQIEQLSILKVKREAVITSNFSVFDKIYHLLEDCKTYGTLPFSILARFGFVGTIFLKSLLKKNLISIVEYDDFFKSIHTVAKNFVDDFNLFVKGGLSKEEFINSYGHLRPGTYDITSSTYKNNFDGYIDSDIKISKNKIGDTFEFSENTKHNVSVEIKRYGLDFDVNKLISFIIRATEAREKAKFEFTKSLSLVLELIESIAYEYKLPVNDFAYLNLGHILEYRNSSSNLSLIEYFIQNININKKKYALTSGIQLPELIFSKKDINMFFYSKLKPNFVTSSSVVSDIFILDDEVANLDINNKIVFIENADPGYDLIFSHNIKGLVTKYGGAASHMVIRCAELDMPAAIGCGDVIFNELLKYKKISLDCSNHKIRGIH